jgi:hypothetical protein
MHPATQPTPAAVYMLADHLDAALAAGEDLLKKTITWDAPLARSAEDIAEKRGEERAAVEALQALEMMLVARVLRSRECAGELARSGSHMKPIAKLYNAGTALLLDVVKDLGEAGAHDFDTGDGITAYVRSRGLIAADAPAPPAAQRVAVTEEFLIAGRIRLGTVMDLVAMFLDALETHYDLYEEGEGPALAGREEAAPAAEAVL